MGGAVKHPCKLCNPKCASYTNEEAPNRAKLL